MNNQETVIDIPESVCYFLKNKKYLLLLDNQDTPPAKFNWENTVDFYKAKSNIEICKAEFYNFMTSLYNIIWINNLRTVNGISITSCFHKDIDRNIDDLLFDKNDLFRGDEEGAHELKWKFTTGEHNKFYIWLSCYLDSNNKIYLFYYIKRRDSDKKFDDEKEGWLVNNSLIAEGWNIDKYCDFYLVTNDIPKLDLVNRKVNIQNLVSLSTSAIQKFTSFIKTNK